MATNIIYALESPVDAKTYYVGRTTQSLKRPFDHFKNAKNKELKEWLESIPADPFIKILETVKESYDLPARETFWINKLFQDKQPLINKTRPTEKQLRYIDYQIGKFIQEKRKERKLTQEEFANKSGLGLRFVRDLEQGKESCRMDKILQALNVFGATLIPVVR